MRMTNENMIFINVKTSVTGYSRACPTDGDGSIQSVSDTKQEYICIYFIWSATPPNASFKFVRKVKVKGYKKQKKRVKT